MQQFLYMNKIDQSCEQGVIPNSTCQEGIPEFVDKSSHKQFLALRKSKSVEVIYDRTVCPFKVHLLTYYHTSNTLPD